MSPVEGQDDLTRKQRREQARAQRKAVEEAQAAKSAQRKRLIQLGGLAAAVVVIVAIILIATSGGSSKAPAPTSKAASQASSEVTALLSGIHQSGNTLGNSNAPVTLQYFGDLECPICREFTLGALPSLISKYVRAGKLRIEYHSLSTATGNAERQGAEPSGTFNSQQIAAYAAGGQSKAWNYIETLYHEQGEEDSGYVTESYLQGIASQVPGLNIADWTTARKDPAYAAQVEADAQAANNEGFTGTPSFLIGKSGGGTEKLEYTSLTEPGSFEAAIEKLLKS